MPEVSISKYRVDATWDDVPHLTKEAKEALLSSTPEHMRSARMYGVPTVGEGKVFTIPEEQIRVQPFVVPRTWPGIGGLDFGWTHPAAACLIRIDPDSGTAYVTHGFRGRRMTPVMMWDACKAWIRGFPVAWPRDGINETQASGGEALKQQYAAVGFKLLPIHAQFQSEGGRSGSVSVHAGIVLLTQMMQSGRFKVFASVADFWPEYRLYSYKDGKLVKLNDDLLSAIRYAVMMRRYARVEAVSEPLAAIFGILDPDAGY